MKTRFYILTFTFAFLTMLFFVMFHAVGGDLMFTLFITSLTFFYHLYIRIFVGAVVNKIKVKYNPFGIWFRQKAFEKDLYKKLKVKSWKKKMPTFEPDSFSFELNTPDEIVQNMCGAEIIHEINIPASFLSLLFCLLCDNPLGNIAIFIVTSIIAAAFDLVFVIIQRYNRERVLHLLSHKRFYTEQSK